MRIHRDLAFVHGLEQRRLGFGSGAVDLVGQQDVGENRSALELKLLLDGGVDRDAKNVRRQHVAGELHSLKAAVDGPRQCLAERRLAHPRDAFDQQVSASQHRDQRQPDDVILAANHLAQRVFQLRRAMGHGNSGFRRHREILLCDCSG